MNIKAKIYNELFRILDNDLWIDEEGCPDYDYLTDQIHSLITPEGVYKEEYEEACEFVDIEIVKVEGLGRAVEILKYERDKALSLPTPQGVGWVIKCKKCKGKGEYTQVTHKSIEGIETYIWVNCSDCNGKGEISRPATREEVDEALPKTIEKLDWFYENSYYHDKKALIVNGGQLRVKIKESCENCAGTLTGDGETIEHEPFCADAYGNGGCNAEITAGFWCKNYERCTHCEEHVE